MKKNKNKVNSKEGSDQESIQLPNNFRQRHQRERMTHLKQRHHNQNTKAESQKDRFVSQKWPNGFYNKKITRIYMQRHTMAEIVDHSRNIAFERSVKNNW